MTTTAFDHLDRMTRAPEGAAIITCEPVSAQRMPQGNRLTLPDGTHLRKSFMGGGLWCKADYEGRIISVVIEIEHLGALELKP
jgi:hypothetical protein